jgi:hypothetical protein
MKTSNRVARVEDNTKEEVRLVWRFNSLRVEIFC